MKRQLQQIQSDTIAVAASCNLGKCARLLYFCLFWMDIVTPLVVFTLCLYTILTAISNAVCVHCTACVWASGLILCSKIQMKCTNTHNNNENVEEEEEKNSPRSRRLFLSLFWFCPDIVNKWTNKRYVRDSQRERRRSVCDVCAKNSEHANACVMRSNVFLFHFFPFHFVGSRKQ